MEIESSVGTPEVPTVKAKRKGKGKETALDRESELEAIRVEKASLAGRRRVIDAMEKMLDDRAKSLSK